MAKEEPFILSKRKNSPYYQVRFKNPNKDSKVRYLPAKSTGETSHSKAIVKAWSMYNCEKVKAESLVQSTVLSELEENDIIKLLDNLKQNGKITSFSLPTEKGSIPFITYLLDFWDMKKSPYIAEKRRLNKHIGISHIEDSRKIIETYWKPFFKDCVVLSEVTKNNLKEFIRHIDLFPVSSSRKLNIYRAGATAIKWAFNDELIERDITAGIISFSSEHKTRNILTKEIAELLFTTKWSDNRCKLINLIAMLTGMRLGEILALKKEDLGQDCFYVNHSWNKKEGLKTPKNGETRVVYFPFPNIILTLLKLVETRDLNSFIFYAPFTPDKPLDFVLPNKALKRQLDKIGVSKDKLEGISFHSWRHFYTTYMSDKLNQRILMSQTGHKTNTMVTHYSNHRIESDVKTVEIAQEELFGDIVKKSGF